MNIFTLSCANGNCPVGWEEDRQYKNIIEAQEEAGVDWCPRCSSGLKVITDAENRS